MVRREAYVEEFFEDEAAKKALTSHIVSKNNSRISNNWRLIEEQIIILMWLLRDTERHSNQTMNDLILHLSGKYNQRPYPMHVGKALRRLGWKKVRD